MAGKKKVIGPQFYDLLEEIETKIPVIAEKEKSAAATIKEKPPSSSMKNEILYIDIDEIKPNPMQPRKNLDPEKIDELAVSIETYGLIQPIILQKATEGYELVAGERRWRAARRAGLKAIPSIVREVTEEENALFAIIENMQREDLNTIEEAAAYKVIIQKYRMTQEGLAKVVGKSRSYVANTLRTLDMQEEIVELLRSGELTLGHANALGAVKDAKQQLILAKRVVKNGLSVREAERLSAAAETKPLKKAAKSAKPVEIRVVEQELTSATGVRVKITGNGEKGNVELQYFDREGLEEIIELLRNAGTGRK